MKFSTKPPYYGLAARIFNSSCVEHMCSIRSTVCKDQKRSNLWFVHKEETGGLQL